MTNEKMKELCMTLMTTDSEDEVIRILIEHGYWSNPEFWRFYGDNENNFSTIGNQQSRPDAALVEKLINCVDHRLLNECLVRGIDPEGPDAPQSIVEAVASFFDSGQASDGLIAGRIRNWPTAKRTEVARGITFVATGETGRNGFPSFTISDAGEGQTPERMPETLLSLSKSNKLRIPFVQGKFNMGGTGVLKFCGNHNLQLVISRRNPAILTEREGRTSDRQWSFTIVRREDPEGNRRSSVYTYLAPIASERKDGSKGVLRFSANDFPIFPDGKNAYGRNTEFGTLIKLYEYRATGLKTNILLRDGMLSRMDMLLPDVALPIRFHECRDYRGHAGSFETTLTGLGVRLDDDKAENLESGFPASCPLSVSGQHMTATIYAFKKGKANSYRKTEGVLFTINGQTHGYLTLDFFRRKSIGLSYLADSILMVVDCSELSGRAREDLFMNSRDRLSFTALRHDIEDALADLLKHHDGLRALKERRRSEELESSLQDSKPLAEILETLFKHSPTLSELFSVGSRLSNPFRSTSVRTEEEKYKGERFPTYFRFRGKEYGSSIHRDCHVNMRSRLMFETDAENDYFSRRVEPGSFSVILINGENQQPVDDYSLNLQNGIATLNVRLPEASNIGDELVFCAITSDPYQLKPFENRFFITVKSAVDAEPRERTRRTKPPTTEPGEDRSVPSGIQFPERIPVPEADWAKHEPPFDQHTALRIKHAGEVTGLESSSKDVYDFYINVDNLHLKRYLRFEKSSNHAESVVQTRFEVGMVLVGLALIHQSSIQKQAVAEEDGMDNQTANLELQVEKVSSALAPFLLPMIQALGALEVEEVAVAHASGEAT
jgi:hypothetical protein